MPVYRRAAIVGVKIIWSVIKRLTTASNVGSIPHDKLLEQLISCGHFVHSDVISTVLEHAVSDGLVIKTSDDLYQLPSTNWKQNYAEDQPDWYCYECHSGGEVTKCESCLRVFHVSCIIDDAEKQQLWDKLDYHRAGASKNILLKYKEPDQEKIDNNSDKSNNPTISDDSNLRKFCYGCRLIYKGKLNSQNNEMSVEELNYLLKFVFNRVHSWIKPDTFSLQDETLPKASYIKDNVQLSVSNLLRFDTTIAAMRIKLENQVYTSIEEFLRDILDIGHNLALVYGRHSIEFESSNYLFADAQFEIGEIKTCRDCYRHSNEKFDRFWFTVPCATRKHELVYAKFPGFSYWPAKVIKINEEDKYDVRFFGSDHSRAIIHKRNVEPITKNLRQLNNGQKPNKSLQEAINELHEHQKRLEIPLSEFTFDAEREIRENNTCKFVPNPSPAKKVTDSDKKRKNRRSESISSAQSNSEKRSNSRNKITNSNINNKKEEKKIEKTIKKANEIQNNALPPKDPEKIDESKNEPEAIKSNEPSEPVKEQSPLSNETKSDVPRRKLSIDQGPAPKKVKLERERRLKEESLKSQKSSQSELSNSNNDTNHKKEFKHSGLKKLDKRLDCATTVEEAREIAMTVMQEELEIFQRKVKRLKEDRDDEIKHIKRRFWCRNCYEIAELYCCWNTAYCSRDCQVAHWEHHRPICKHSNVNEQKSS
uniref:CSON014297 protein n=1 Tax=Culicoides sonorensis TaxID=179676 RepID=A0A336MAE7_CULSO